MYLLYIDESGDPGFSRSGTKHYVLLGVAIADRNIRTISERLEQIITRYFKAPPSPRELHYRDLLRAKPPFHILSQEQRISLADDIFKAVRDEELTLFATVIDKHAHSLRYLHPKRPDLLALELVIERFEHFLKRVDDVGCVVYDSRGKVQDEQLRDFFAQLRLAGTSIQRITHIVETIFFTPSDSTRILQLADFCAYAVFSKFEHQKGNRFQQIQMKFDRDKQGRIVGLKTWAPK